MRLLEQEYAVASIDYRLLDEGGQFPANLYDCKAAVRWVRAHAEALGVDPNRIGAMGHSSGGHLAGLLGTTDVRPDAADLEVRRELDDADRVAVLLDFRRRSLRNEGVGIVSIPLVQQRRQGLPPSALPGLAPAPPARP